MATFDYACKKPSSSAHATGLTTNLASQRKSPPSRGISPSQGGSSDHASIQPQSDRDENGRPAWWSRLTWNPQRPGAQPKLTIGQPNDQYEQEADRVASEVVNQISTPPPSPIQRMDNLEEEELQAKPLNNSIAPEVQRADNLEEELQMKPVPRVAEAGGMDASPDLESSIAQARGGGQSLDQSIREQIEQAMGADFSGVKVHTNAQADQLNRSIQARAFTTGQDVFFRQGEYNPGSRWGQELIAHELTHVVQQNDGAVVRSPLTSQQPQKHSVTEKPSVSVGDCIIQSKAEITSAYQFSSEVPVQRVVSFPNDPAVKDLNSLEQVAAQNAVEYAKNIADKAYKKAFIIKTDPAARAAYQKWFGSFTDGNPSDEARWQQVKRIINSAIRTVQGNLTIYRGNNQDPGLYAYVYPNNPGTIYLGPAFFNGYKNKDIIDTVGGTILHEVTHYTNVGATNDHAYGQQDCLNLASTNPDAAANNADNYLYFAEEFIDVRFEV